MTNINRDPLLRAIYDAAQTIEACGASEALTAAVMAVTAIYQHADRVLDERDAVIRRAEAAERDAARYRWLRNDALQVLVAGPLCVLADRWGDLRNLHEDEQDPKWAEKKFAPVTVDGVDLDNAIDAARAEGA